MDRVSVMWWEVQLEKALGKVIKDTDEGPLRDIFGEKR